MKEIIFCGLMIYFIVADSPTKGPYSAIVRVREGTQVTLSCPVDGRPEANITWYKGNDTTAEIQHQGREWTFQAESNDAGWYSCSARNFLNPFKPVNANFQLIVGKLSSVFILFLKGNNIVILLIKFIVIFFIPGYANTEIVSYCISDVRGYSEIIYKGIILTLSYKQPRY